MRGIESAGSVSDRVRARDADQHGGAAAAGREERGQHRLAAPGRLDRVVDAAAGRLAHRLGRRFRRAGPADGIAVAPSESARLELGVVHVDRDDRRGAHGDRAHQRREPDAAAADHRDALAGPDPGASATPRRRRWSRRTRRAPRSRAERRRVSATHERLGHDRMLGERRQERVVVDRRRRRATAGVVPSISVPPVPIAGHAVRAQVRQVAQALRAATAGRRPGQRDVVAARRRG